MSNSTCQYVDIWLTYDLLAFESPYLDVPMSFRRRRFVSLFQSLTDLLNANVHFILIEFLSELKSFKLPTIHLKLGLWH